MRLHELEVTAFGPFVDTVRVDFDELSAGGLFLLTGDTGAGKTSVLDAVCFALYGEVPGDRHTARHLRSDHAAPSAEPRVVLRLAIGGRTFRFTRSPMWDRPKKRGTGSIRVQAHVVVEELVDGTWTALTHRLDEAGHLVTGLLGMTCTQFTQVAMLPQNRFQAFLRASSGERQAVLQRLFRTQRFEAVERWLVDRRVTLRRDSQACHDRTAGVVNRLREAAQGGGTDAWPDAWDVRALDVPADDGTLLAWAEQLASGATTEAQAREAALTEASAAVGQARTELDRGREVVGLRERGERARTVLRGLATTAGAERELAARLDAHHRAAPAMPLVRRAGLATEAVSAAEDAADEHLGRTATVLDVEPDRIDLATLTAATTRLSESRAVAEAWLPRERELADEETRATALTAEVGELATAVEGDETELAALGERRDVLTSAAERAHAVASSSAADERAVEVVSAAWSAARDAVTLARDLAERRVALAAAVEHAQDLRHVYLDLREARISGMAAELAVGLAVGCSCPVCGSAEHPAPATSSSSVTRVDEDAARQAHETADFERLNVDEQVRNLGLQTHAALVASDGHKPAYWERRHHAAKAAATRSAEAAVRAAGLDEELAGLVESEHALSTVLAESRTRLTERTAELRRATTRRDALLAERAALLADHDGSVASLVESLAATLDALAEARDALAALDRARADHRTAVDEAMTAVREAGFASGREAVLAHLSPEKAQARQAELDERRLARATASAALAEPEVLEAMDRPVPDLESLTERAVLAGADRDRAHAAHDQSVRRQIRVEALLGELVAALDAWEPVRRDHTVAANLAALVEGKSTDNALKMRLSAYVLSERLRQVVDAANERLGAMTDQRYTLEQADEKGAGEQRGGLSLRMRDQWSGKQRDPATLSGGETFLVSLALALGLADTVSHEAGGTQLDTLFIDEGFGALDATTLDSVMDTLDSLRDGGRVVGLVSHVAELRTRVTSQLEVRKARHGSTVTPVVVTA